MGRWSRPVAHRFIDWLDLRSGLEWLELGCGTGALTEAVIRLGDPASILAIEPSDGFLSKVREKISDARLDARKGDAGGLRTHAGASRDVAVSGLVLNFVPDRLAALRELLRIVRPGGTVAYYVWDYPGGGVEFMRAFWTAAAALDPAALDLREDRRFPFCTQDGLMSLAEDAGLAEISSQAIECPCIFKDFDDFWHPFTLGAGPAPGYCVNLPEDRREALRIRLHRTLPRQGDGSIVMKTRAWAVRGQTH